MYLVAPTEPSELRRLGTTSGVPERHGCDVVWTTEAGGLAEVQRKTLTDLWASVRDGRLAREVAAMRRGLRCGCSCWRAGCAGRRPAGWRRPGRR